MIKDKQAPIVSINRLRIKTDGEGIRSLVFFYGCKLRCKYCINPHTWDLTKPPEFYTTESLLKEVKIDDIYFRCTNGGVTFGGGEPLLHSGFIKEFIEKAPSAWNYWVETSLAVEWGKVEAVAPFITKFVVDIKSLDRDVYKAYTGMSLDLARSNLIKLLAMVGSEKIIVRVPFIPNYMRKDQQLESVEKLKNLGAMNIEVFDYTTEIKGGSYSLIK